ncbi:CoA transferase [Actinomadura sp. LD22]|uniref:CoA transferase n=1 Tax=Actinomadura physcomitrii TaxID=2650748 RepID=A0A6I4MB75_9ACTN|nr:CaiB/BaiF CoA-transferase family protein [Actinomadura physcomitrii]MWA02913.1 CoA transferase [Actinomadura physcomitrii]
MTGTNTAGAAGDQRRGPLKGVRVLELAGLGPGPYGAMLLADLGADVVRVDRAGATAPDSPEKDIVQRGRRSVAADLKTPGGRALVRRLAAAADVLIDPFRPGVTERLGIGPDACTADNPRLIYARMTGFGQDGPLAAHAGHDINYVALAGALAHIGRRGEPPTPPLNLVGDMGGGGLLLAFGVTAALVERASSGRGQVLDVAMVDGVASLMTMMFGYLQQGVVSEERGANVFDSGSHFYDVYACADGRYVAVGAIEAPFFRNLVEAIGLDPGALPRRGDRGRWAESKRILAERFLTRTRDEWCEALAGKPDLCFSPVLTMSEAPRHPHLRERGTFTEIDGVVHPSPAPRFGRTPGSVHHVATVPGEHTDEVVADWLG